MSKKSSIYVFVLSVVICYFSLILERYLGIEWNYHPDAETYIDMSADMASVVLQSNFFLLPNNLYYFIVWLLNNSIILGILLNIIIFSITNVLISHMSWNYMRDIKINYKTKLILLALLLFTPYRIHLAIHLLKDTFIIALLCLLASNIRFRWLSWFPLYLLRVACYVYAPIFIPRKYLIVSVLAISIFVVFQFDYVQNIVSDANLVDMQFRDYDNIPRFESLGGFAAFIRGLIWPFFVLTGVFIFFSPSIFFVPIAVGALMTQIFCLILFKRVGIFIGAYLPMMVLAIGVNSFTTYYRYCFPIFVIIPLILMHQFHK